MSRTIAGTPFTVSYKTEVTSIMSTRKCRMLLLSSQLVSDI